LAVVCCLLTETELVAPKSAHTILPDIEVLTAGLLKAFNSKLCPKRDCEPGQTIYSARFDACRLLFVRIR
jgi:hypothetical protein